MLHLPFSCRSYFLLTSLIVFACFTPTLSLSTVKEKVKKKKEKIKDNKKKVQNLWALQSLTCQLFSNF